MYCKHCGKEIDNNSSFCQYCGKKVGENEGTVVLDYKKLLITIYVIWVIINTILLIIGNSYHAPEPLENFFPSSPYLADYDVTEFILYCLIIPFVIYLIVANKDNIKNYYTKKS